MWLTAFKLKKPKLQMKIFTNKLLLIAIASLITASAFAQSPRFKKKYRYSSVGANIGVANYVGELDPGQSFISPALKFTRSCVGVEIVHRMAPRISYRGDLSWARIKGNDIKNSNTAGDDIYRNVRGLNFRSDIFALKFDVMIDMYPNRSGLKRRISTPYMFLGVGVFYHNPMAEIDGGYVPLKPLGTEGQNMAGVGDGKKYSLIQPQFPVGIGYRYKLSTLFDLAIEFGWRLTLTDYLDDVSTTYTDKSYFEYNSLGYRLSDRSLINTEGAADYSRAQALIERGHGHRIYSQTDANGNVHTYMSGYGQHGEQRGDKNRDYYTVLNIHLTYIFHPRVICPKFR